MLQEFRCLILAYRRKYIDRISLSLTIWIITINWRNGTTIISDSYRWTCFWTLKRSSPTNGEGPSKWGYPRDFLAVSSRRHSASTEFILGSNGVPSCKQRNYIRMNNIRVHIRIRLNSNPLTALKVAKRFIDGITTNWLEFEIAQIALYLLLQDSGSDQKPTVISNQVREDWGHGYRIKPLLGSSHLHLNP